MRSAIVGGAPGAFGAPEEGRFDGGGFFGPVFLKVPRENVAARACRSRSGGHSPKAAAKAREVLAQGASRRTWLPDHSDDFSAAGAADDLHVAGAIHQPHLDSNRARRERRCPHRGKRNQIRLRTTRGGRVSMAERVGFEPTRPFGPTGFRDRPINHSSTSPRRGTANPSRIGPTVRLQIETPDFQAARSGFTRPPEASRPPRQTPGSRERRAKRGGKSHPLRHYRRPRRPTTPAGAR